MGVLRTSHSPLELFDSLNQHLRLDGSVQYFYPYRGYREEILRVELDSPYSIMFDLSKKGTISLFNDISKLDFVKFRDRFFSGNTDSAEKFVLDKVKKYKQSGIHTIAKGRDFLKIQTVFMDSTYDLIKQINQNFSDSFYLKLKKNRGNINGYCLAYYLFNKPRLAFPYVSPRRLYKINDKLYYYREPLLP